MYNNRSAVHHTCRTDWTRLIYMAEKAFKRNRLMTTVNIVLRVTGNS